MLWEAHPRVSRPATSCQQPGPWAGRRSQGVGSCLAHGKPTSLSLSLRNTDSRQADFMHELVIYWEKSPHWGAEAFQGTDLSWTKYKLPLIFSVVVRLS